MKIEAKVFNYGIRELVENLSSLKHIEMDVCDIMMVVIYSLLAYSYFF